MEDIDTQNNSLIIDLWKKTWTTSKETTRWMRSWSRNRLFTGLTLWPGGGGEAEEEEEEEDLDDH